MAGFSWPSILQSGLPPASIATTFWDDGLCCRHPRILLLKKNKRSGTAAFVALTGSVLIQSSNSRNGLGRSGILGLCHVYLLFGSCFLPFLVFGSAAFVLLFYSCVRSLYPYHVVIGCGCCLALVSTIARCLNCAMSLRLWCRLAF